MRRAKAWCNSQSRITASLPGITSDYLSKILTAQVYEVANESPIQFAPILSHITKGNKLFLKREDTQPVFSFKIRGAYNKIIKLKSDLLERGVICCSAGNHGQGVAFSANKLQIPAYIVMPLATPSIKVAAVRRFGGKYTNVLLHGQNYDEAASEARRLMREKGFTMIHPFDDPDVIAGQGTVGIEIVKAFNAKALDAIFVCTGGGGLLAGVAAAVKSLRPDILIIGVEAHDAAGMTTSLSKGQVYTLPQVGLFADGAAVKTIGTETFKICEKIVDEMITVSTDEICAAIKHGFSDTRSVMEPAGALGIAGMMKYIKERNWSNKTCVAITTGSNIDFDRLRFVSERADLSEIMFAVTIPERPGSFRELYSLIYPRNVTEFSYRQNGNLAHEANVILSLQVKQGKNIDDDRVEILEELRNSGYKCIDLSDNELAKSHARHLSGGRAGIEGEVLYRFEFPEAPGALNKFLHTLNYHNQGWNISLWHYRNCGHDVGRVLVGLILRGNEKIVFNNFLENLGYTYSEETGNPVYKYFLK